MDEDQKAPESEESVEPLTRLERVEKAVRALIQGNPEGARAEMGS